MTRSRLASGILAIALLVAAGPVPVAADEAPPASPPPAAGGWAPPQFKLDASLRLGHASNLYHAQERHEPDFDTETAEYQRYYRMKGPGDAEARLALDLAWRFKHASKRAIGLRLRSRHFAYQDNEIANHDDFRFDATFAVSKNDRIRLTLGYAPERFRKNRKYEAFPGITVYGRSDARDTAQDLEYTRDLGKKWSASVALATGRRDYAEPFDGRDEDIDSWGVSVRHDLTKRIALELSYAGESTATPSSLESGTPKDRSHDDAVSSLGIDLNLRHGWSAWQSSHYTVRDYTTGEVTDTSRYGRTDRRWALDGGVEKALSDHWSVALDAAWTNNDSGREEAGVADSEFDYTDVDVGVTVSFRN